MNIYKSFSEVKVSNTTIETEIFRFNFKEFLNLYNGNNSNLLGDNQWLNLKLSGYVNANSGGTPSIELKAYLDTTFIGGLACDPAGGYPYFNYELDLVSRELNSIMSNRKFEIGDTNGNSGESRQAFGTVPVTINIDEVDSLIITCTMSTASASLELTKTLALVKLQ